VDLLPAPNVRPPEWVLPFLAAVAAAQASIDSHSVDSLTSDLVLAQLRPGLQALGFEVESGKQRDQKIRRPVLFSEQGHERVAYEVDAVRVRGRDRSHVLGPIELSPAVFFVLVKANGDLSAPGARAPL
jgi:hypothetical protein